MIDPNLGLKIRNRESDGFTLVELVVVMAILGIIVAIAIPSLTIFKNIAEESVCNANRKTAEKMYNAFLIDKEIGSENAFGQFLIENFDEVCPSGGIIRYETGKVKCSVHEDGSDEDDSPGNEVPWL